MDGENQQTDGLPGQQIQGPPSPGNDGTPSTPKEETVTLSKTELHELVNTAADEKHAKLDKQVSDLTKQIQPLQNALTAANTMIQTLQSEKRQAELKAFEGQPDALAIVAERHKLEDQREEHNNAVAQFEAQKSEYSATLAAAEKILRDSEIAKIAAEKGIDANLLSNFGGETPEKIREYADTLIKSGVKSTKAGAGGQPPPGGENNQQQQQGAPRPGAGGGSGSGAPSKEYSDLDRAKNMLAGMNNNTNQ